MHVARLARLHLKDEEIEAMTGQLDSILSYVEKLSELNTDGVVPTTHAIDIHNAFREDQVAASLSRDEALANAPKRDAEAFVVPRII